MLQEGSGDHALLQRNLSAALRRRAMPAETLSTTAGQLSGPLLIKPEVFGDDRGFFYESWNERRFNHDLISAGVLLQKRALQFRQDNRPLQARSATPSLPAAARTTGQVGALQCGRGAM